MQDNEDTQDPADSFRAGAFRGYTVVSSWSKVSAGAGVETILTGLWGARSPSDSATMMNKGLEVIGGQMAVRYVPLDRIQVVVHPQSVLHSAVEMKTEFCDRSDG